MRYCLALLCIAPLWAYAQVTDDFSDGDFHSNPTWFGDTSQFMITSSSAIPSVMKPALQLNGSGPDTSVLFLPCTLTLHTGWKFWIKLSFNTSANNHTRVYLISDQPLTGGPPNGYFIQVGGQNDSISLVRQSGDSLLTLIKGTNAFTGNSTNTIRIRVSRDSTGTWNLWSDITGGYGFLPEGQATDNFFQTGGYFGIWCRYTGSNASKFYFDDFVVSPWDNDTAAPSLVSAGVHEESLLDLMFSEDIDPFTSANTGLYNVNQGVGHPLEARRDEENHDLVHLTFPGPFQPEMVYTIATEGILDLSGNMMESQSLPFSCQAVCPGAPFDIIVTELMPDINPAPAGLPEAEYLEMYNRSGQPLELAGWTLRPRESVDPIPLPSCTLLPDSFLIISSPGNTALFEPYGEVKGLPGFSLNNEGCVILRNRNGLLIQCINYHTSWYGNPEKEEGGWALEMNDFAVPCLQEGNWTASADPSGGTPGCANSCQITATAEPAVTGVLQTAPDRLAIRFRHQMDSLQASRPEAYYLEGTGYPASATISPPETEQVILHFTKSLPQDALTTLRITDTLTNCSGLMILPGTDITVVLPVDGGTADVIIHEIMADPLPPAGLPEFEYIELYNRTSSWIRMRDWTLRIGTVSKNIPETVMNPGSYLLLTEDEAAQLYSLYSPALGFTSLGLDNGGDCITLFDPAGTAIHSVCYNDLWYRDDGKREGGWSLEMIDAGNPCREDGNWTASINGNGGTPGNANSVAGILDMTPGFVRLEDLDPRNFVLRFTDHMDPDRMLSPDNYRVDHSIGQPVGVTAGPDSLSSVVLSFSAEIHSGIVYELTAESDIANCTGIPLPKGSSVSFGILEVPSEGDLCFNEILFHPSASGAEFIELYNRSDRILDLSAVMLGLIKQPDYELPDTTFYRLATDRLPLFPGECLVLTGDPATIKEQYTICRPDGFLVPGSLPTLPDDGGSLVLLTTGGTFIERVDYDESMHFPLLNTFSDVSLERISTSRSGIDPANWHSASSASGFATPTCPNSQTIGETMGSDPVWLDPEVFSPDNDGHDDNLVIHYHFESPGLTANVTIFDPSGRLVRYLEHNAYVGTEGIFTWDGIAENGSRAAIGLYLVCFEIYDTGGMTSKYKRCAVLAGNFY
ncbi:MAG: lamin tail domain-containing protein [Bacteroidales bacterium]|nr:lamin tail domain-containing protein [Bacteroidales bacterium]